MAPTQQLIVDELSVHYGRRRAVSAVSLTVQPGMVTSVVGPNGAGKSSLLNAIAGLIPPSSGSVVLNGAEIVGLPAEKTFRRGLALVPEGKRVFASLTVEENMRLAAAAFGSEDVMRRTDECLRLFPRIEGRRKQRASYLSGGEQQQLMIARSLVGRPAYLLLDEPSMGLSPQLVQEVFQIVTKLAADGVGILLVEQFVRQAVAISGHVHLLARGSIVRSFSGDEARAALSEGDFFEAYSGRSRSEPT